MAQCVLSVVRGQYDSLRTQVQMQSDTIMICTIMYESSLANSEKQVKSSSKEIKTHPECGDPEWLSMLPKDKLFE